MGTNKNNEFPPIRIRRDIKEKLDELKKVLNAVNYSDVIEYLLEVYEKSKSKEDGEKHG